MKKKTEPISIPQQDSEIILQGIKTNNLKDIDLVLPKNKLITITWVSWSWKSSLAFETIYKEGQYRYIESLSSFLRQYQHLIKCSPLLLNKAHQKAQNNKSLHDYSMI